MHPLVGDLSGQSVDDLLKQLDSLHQKLSYARRSGNQGVASQLINLISSYQEEYNKRRMAEVRAAEQNPIFKDSLDIG